MDRTETRSATGPSVDDDEDAISIRVRDLKPRLTRSKPGKEQTRWNRPNRAMCRYKR